VHDQILLMSDASHQGFAAMFATGRVRDRARSARPRQRRWGQRFFGVPKGRQKMVGPRRP